jgi:hypothetical protein
MPNRTLKILILSNGVLNWDGVSKLNVMPKIDHATFLRLDIKTHCKSSILKCSYVNNK